MMSRLRTLAQVILGALLLFTGTAHLTFARTEFRAQVPPWVPLEVDLVVVLSGVVEIVLGAGLLLVRRQPARTVVGAVTAAFFVVVLPGNIAQYTEQRDAFGLTSDTARAIRLLFQPVLVVWALWCTEAHRWWRRHRSSDSGDRRLRR